MDASHTISTYAVGRGKPPLATRFKKGQSGNPSGKPGPAKLAKMRFERALCAALAGSLRDLESSTPDTMIAGLARQMALDAAAGRMPAIRLVLSLIDKAAARVAAGQSRPKGDGADASSLVQAKTQGSEKIRMADVPSPGESNCLPGPRAGETAPAAPEPRPNGTGFPAAG